MRHRAHTSDIIGKYRARSNQVIAAKRASAHRKLKGCGCCGSYSRKETRCPIRPLPPFYQAPSFALRSLRQKLMRVAEAAQVVVRARVAPIWARHAAALIAVRRFEAAAIEAQRLAAVPIAALRFAAASTEVALIMEAIGRAGALAPPLQALPSAPPLRRRTITTTTTATNADMLRIRPAIDLVSGART